MNYYNVIIEVNEKNSKGIYVKYYELDNTDLNDIKNSIIYPFLKKDSIFIDGRYINASDVRMLKVKQAQKRTDDLKASAQAKVPPRVFVVHTRTSILNDNYTEDITKETLREAGDELKSFESQTINKTIENNQEINDKVFIVHGHDELAKVLQPDLLNKLV